MKKRTAAKHFKPTEDQILEFAVWVQGQVPEGEIETHFFSSRIINPAIRECFGDHARARSCVLQGILEPHTKVGMVKATEYRIGHRLRELVVKSSSEPERIVTPPQDEGHPPEEGMISDESAPSDVPTLKELQQLWEKLSSEDKLLSRRRDLEEEIAELDEELEKIAQLKKLFGELRRASALI